MESKELSLSSDQKFLIKRLSGRMYGAGIVLTVIGIMLFAEGFSKELSYLFAGSVNIIIGIFTIFAAKSFQKILDQQGDVLVALITSFKYQSQLYSLQFWIYSAAAFVMLLGTAASFILETSHIKINR